MSGINKFSDGSVCSSSLPYSEPGSIPDDFSYGLSRAIVLSTKYWDEGLVPTNGTMYENGSVECDILFPNGHSIPNVPVCQGMGRSNGTMWTPNPTTFDTIQQTPVFITPSTAGVIAPTTLLMIAATKIFDGWDGDRVLVAFIAGDDPVIIGRAPHPMPSPLVRTKNYIKLPVVKHLPHPAMPEGLCQYVQHQGTKAGIDEHGNVFVDTVLAGLDNAGNPLPSLANPSNPSGTVSVNLSPAERLEVRIAGVPYLTVDATGVHLGSDSVAGGGAAVLGVARATDPVSTTGTVTDVVFEAWTLAVSNAINTLAPGTFGPGGVPIPEVVAVTSSGTIASGSLLVKSS